ncbi:hypothetical protein HPB51_015827 [Rhipicephalus microplus]|uniref:Uncharacterized protein n=1 Tax=Rhipicephalus microplus TaxID=6941 RepID=A0A9J6F4F7_RHIMP|nr:hypothetical protein HPB51_015827 [Rhipicephalus microplus]
MVFLLASLNGTFQPSANDCFKAISVTLRVEQCPSQVLPKPAISNPGPALGRAPHGPSPARAGQPPGFWAPLLFLPLKQSQPPDTALLRTLEREFMLALFNVRSLNAYAKNVEHDPVLIAADVVCFTET